jgi:hypothetical protein
MTPTRSLFRLLPLALAAHALAQQDVSEANKHCWAENIGYINWRDAGSPAESQGARLHATFLSGHLWGENVGWITLGDGAPTNGTAYSNTDGADAGVNLDPATGHLSGLAWGENIGWINFSGGALATPPNPARVATTAPHRLHGYAWGENIGWINLDDAGVFVEFVTGGCRADWNGDGAVNSNDISAFLTSWLASISGGSLEADFDGSGAVNSNDISAFLTAWLGSIGGDCT